MTTGFSDLPTHLRVLLGIFVGCLVMLAISLRMSTRELNNQIHHEKLMLRTVQHIPTDSPTLRPPVAIPGTASPTLNQYIVKEEIWKKREYEGLANRTANATSVVRPDIGDEIEPAIEAAVDDTGTSNEAPGVHKANGAATLATLTANDINSTIALADEEQE